MGRIENHLQQAAIRDECGLNVRRAQNEAGHIFPAAECLGVRAQQSCNKTQTCLVSELSSSLLGCSEHRQ